MSEGMKDEILWLKILYKILDLKSENAKCKMLGKMQYFGKKTR